VTNTGFTTCIPLARNGAAILLAAGLLLAPAAQADWYFGAKTGPMMIDVGGFDDPTNVGVLVGHEWGVVAGDIGVEAELTRTLDDGEFAGQDVKVDTGVVLQGEAAVEVVAGDDVVEALLLQGRPIGEPVARYGEYSVKGLDELAEEAQERRWDFGLNYWFAPQFVLHGALELRRFTAREEGERKDTRFLLQLGYGF